MNIIKIKENKDGSITIDYELNAKDIAILKKVAKDRKRRYTKKFINKFMLEALNNAIEDYEFERGIK